MFEKLNPQQVLKTFFQIFLETCCRKKSSPQRCSVKKAVLKNFAIFTGKHLC